MPRTLFSVLPSSLKFRSTATCCSTVPFTGTLNAASGRPFQLGLVRKALKVWVTQFCCTNTGPAVRGSSKKGNKSKIKILCARESKLCDRRGAGGWIGFFFLRESCANLWSRTPLKTDLLLCAMSDWKGIWGFFLNPLDLEEEQKSSVKLSARIFPFKSFYRMLCVCPS